MRFFGLLLAATSAPFLLASGEAFDDGTTASHDKRVGCYWGTWSFYRYGYGKFDVGNFDASLCTHGYYGFADMSNETWNIVPYDPWYDLAPEDCDPGYCNYDSYRRFVALADDNPNFTPILSVGGWTAGSGKFSEMAADPAKKQIFMDSVIPFLTKYGFKGLDFDWEYPGSREGADPEEDKEHFTVLIEQLSDLLHENDLILTSALSPGKPTIDIAYDVPRLSKAFDWMNVMCYDYHGWWDSHNFTGHNSPLYGREEENFEGHPGYYFNVYQTMNYYLQLGAPKEKLVMGMPTYGRGFKLDNWQGVSEEEKGLYCPANAGIPSGPYTRRDGTWGYLEVLQAFNNRTLINLPDGTPRAWEITVDDCYRAPYATNGPYWIGYDDVDSFKRKAQFINFLGVAGGFIWSMDTDDFEGRYYDETYPLIRSLNRALASGVELDPTNPKCKGTAPMCELRTSPTTPQPATTDSGAHYDCDEYGVSKPMPGDCHKYYMCIGDENGPQDVEVFDCGDDAFDPIISACVDPNLPANELLCGDKERVL